MCKFHPLLSFFKSIFLDTFSLFFFPEKQIALKIELSTLFRMTNNVSIFIILTLIFQQIKKILLQLPT